MPIDTDDLFAEQAAEQAAKEEGEGPANDGDFKVFGIGVKPLKPEDEYGIGPAVADIEGMTKAAQENAILKAITNDTILAGRELQVTTTAAIDKLIAQQATFTYSHVLIDNGWAEPVDGYAAEYQKYSIMISASDLQAILVTDGILLPLPPEEEPEEEVLEEEVPEEAVEEEDAAFEVVDATPPIPYAPEGAAPTDANVEYWKNNGSHYAVYPLKPRTKPSLEAGEYVLPQTQYWRAELTPIFDGDWWLSSSALDQPWLKVYVVDEFIGDGNLWCEIKMLTDFHYDKRHFYLREAVIGSGGFRMNRLPAEHMVEYLNLLREQEHIYVLRSSLVPKQQELSTDTPSSLEHVERVGPLHKDYVEPTTAPSDWRNLDPRGYCCQYNPKTVCYETVVETPYQSETDLEADGLTFWQLRGFALPVGIRQLLRYYDKASGPADVATVLNAYKGAYIPEDNAEGFYLAPNPGSFMRFMVSFPARFFDAIPRLPSNLSPMSDAVADTSLRSIHIQLDSKKPDSKFKLDIETVAKRMEEYHDEIAVSYSQVIALDLVAEAKRLRELPAALKAYIEINGWSGLKEGGNSESIEIGLDEDFSVEWALFSGEGSYQYGVGSEPKSVLNLDKDKSFPLSIARGDLATKTDLLGILLPDDPGFCWTEPINSGRTMAYLWYLDKMVEAIETDHITKRNHSGELISADKLTWTNFVQAFTYPIPKIIPGDPPPGVEEEAAEDEPKNPKTTSEFERELKRLRAKEKNTLAAARKSQTDTVGDTLYRDVDAVLARAGCSIESLYNGILNQYGITGLAAIVRGCIGLPDPGIDAQLLCMEKKLPDVMESAAKEAELAEPVKYQSDEWRDRLIIKYALKAAPLALLDCIEMPAIPQVTGIPGADLRDLIFAIPKLPTMVFPDDLSLPDPSGFFGPALEDSIETSVLTALCTTIQGILETLIHACEDGFGLFPADIGPNDVGNTMDDLGLEPSDDANELVAEIVRGSTPEEMASLLEGNSTSATRQRIGGLVQNSHPEINFMSNAAQIDSFFGTLGSYIGPAAIAAARIPSDDNFQPSLTGLLCDEGGEFKDNYSSLLGDRLSPDRARGQADGAQKRLEDLAERLDEILVNPDAVMPDITPDDLLGCGEFAEPVPALDKMANTVLEAILSPVKMAFAVDASYFLSLLIEQEIRGLEEGDVGFTSITEGEKLGWTDVRTNQENETRSRRIEKVVPQLRKDLESSLSFVFPPETDDFRVDMTASARILRPSSFPSPDIEKFKNKIRASEEALAILTREEIKLSEEEHELVDDTIAAKRAQLEAVLVADSDALKTVTDTAITAENLKALMPDFMSPSPISVSLRVPFISDSSRGYRDKFEIRLSSPTALLARSGELSEIMQSPDARPTTVLSDLPVEASGDDAPQAEAFAQFVWKKLLEAGHTIKGTPPEPHLSDTGFHKALKKAHKDIYEDLMTKVSRQNANSPLFAMDELRDISLVPTVEGGDDGTICVPSNATEADLLGIYEIMQDIKDEYNATCEPLGQEFVDEASPSALDDAIKAGIVRLITRVYVVEALLKSIFSFSEFSVNSVLGDRTLIEYVMFRLEEGMKHFGLNFYNDVARAALEVIEKTGQDGLIDPYNIIDMDALLNEGNPLYATGTEALKFIALRELPDISSKLQDKLGVGTPNIHRRFTDIPAPECRDDDESTPVGATVRTPFGEGGWIRTIDVPKSYHYGLEENERFQRSRWEDSDQWFTEAAEQQIKERYPDMERNGGTFFLERYIRIEDLESPPPTYNPLLLKELRSRPGGPDSPDQHARGDKHLSGVVNIKEWKLYIQSLKAMPDLNTTSEKITDYFKPWKYGLRLVWVPKFNPGMTLTESNEWNRLAGSALDFEFDLLLTTFTLGDILDAPVVSTAFDLAGIDSSPDTNADDWDAMYNEANPLSAMPSRIVPHVKASIEENISNNIDFDSVVQQKEKTFAVIEEIERKETIDDTGGISFKDPVFGIEVSLPTFGTLRTFQDYGRRTIYVFPLVTVEAEVQLSEFTLDAARLLEEQTSGPVFTKLKKDLILSADYKFLFEYVFPLPRMLSLMTIYTGNSLSLTVPKIEAAFNTTKGALKSLFYNVAPSDEPWWRRRDEDIAAVGGNAGLHQLHMDNRTVHGPSVDLLTLAAMAVPILVRGCAEYLDPHYSQVSKMVDAGWTGKKDWSKVPPLYPANLPPFMGWGPPLSLLGMAAYSMPPLPGDEKKRKEEKNKARLNDVSSTEDCD